MKSIGNFLLFSFLLLSLLACIASQDITPLLAMALSYGCYRSVFKGSKTKVQLFDPIDFVKDDSNY